VTLTSTPGNVCAQVHSVTIKHDAAVKWWPKLSTDRFEDAVQSEEEWAKFQAIIVDGDVLKCKIHVAISDNGRTTLSLFPEKRLSPTDVAKLL